MSAIEQFPPVDTGLLRFSTAGSVKRSFAAPPNVGGRAAS